MMPFDYSLYAQLRCGEIKRLTPVHPDSVIVAYDRFGNPYLASELALTQQGLCPNAGFFVLDYTNIGSFTADEQNTICQVFYDLSNLIENPGNVLIQIKITKTLLDTDEGATGTPLFTPGCGIGYPRALALIKGLEGTATLTASGTLDINSFFTWHTINNDPLSPGSNLPDLYSAVLHEALHILGVGSLISTMGTPITGSYYSNWDLSLKTESGTPMIVPGVGPGMELECCDQHKFNPELASPGQVSSFLSGLINNCGGSSGPPRIIYDLGTGNPTVNGLGSLANALSHLDEDCDNLPSNEYYVMHHTLMTGETRRTLHQKELQVLQQLGYQLNGSGGSDEDCIVIAESDTYNNFSLAVGQTIIIPYAFLLSNDVFPPNATLTIGYAQDLTQNHELIDVTSIDTDGDGHADAFSITALGALQQAIMLVYYIEACDEVCDDATFTLSIVDGVGVLPPCQSATCCGNLLCYGDFEAYVPLSGLYWLQSGLDPFFENIGAFQNGNNSPDIAYEGPNQNTPTNRFMRLRTTESFYMPLTCPIPAGCTLKLTFRAGGGIIPAILASATPPCLLSGQVTGCQSDYGDLCLIDGSPSASYSPVCIPGSNIDPPGNALDEGTTTPSGWIYYNSQNVAWQTYELTWANNSGQEVNYLTFHGVSVVRIDDIEVEKICPAQVSLQLPPASQVCIGQPAQLCYEVCVSGIVPGHTVWVETQLTLPAGVALVGVQPPTLLSFTADGCQEVCLSVISQQPISNGAILLAASVCGQETGQVAASFNAVECFSCEDCPSASIGTPGTSTMLGDLLQTPNNPLGNGENVNVCIDGTLVIDQNFNFVNSILFMKPGAQIDVLTGKKLALVHTALEGCDEMWRGIVVQKGGGVKMEHCRVADAQYAVKAHPAENDNEPIAELTILGNDFDNNFVGLLIPQTPYAKINAVLSRNVFSGFDELKHPYTGQSAAPESLPEQNQRALAGMVVNNLGAFSSYDNRFEQLTSGIVNRGSNLTAHLNDFADIQTNETLYPAFAPAGIALANYAAGHNVVAATDNIFNDCPMGILANLCELKATGNTLDYVDRGIWASLAGAGGIAIDNNEMAHTQVGILVAHAHAAGQVSITGNTVKTEAAGNGTGIITLYNHAPAVVENNAVTVGKAGLGISIYAGKGAQLLENNVILADQNLAGAGISLTYAQQCLLQDNAITGVGLGGPGNIGIEIVASPGNVYCCNTVGNTRMGVSVSGGSLATDKFRGTTFGNHATSLYLPDVNAVLGSQSHTQNKWTGTGAAVYGVSQQIAAIYAFIVDIASPNGSPDNEPVSHSPTGWFAYDENPTTSTACDPSVCMTPLFYSESDDVKRIAGGDTSLSPVTLWELQRYIYAGLTGQYVQHAGILSFLSQSDTSSIGTFHNLDRRLAESFQIDTAVSPELQAIFYHTNEKMESLKSIDQFLLQADSVQTIEALESRKVVVNDLYELSEQQQNLIQVLENNVTSAANGLSDENEGILATTIFEINTKTLNAIYFKYLASSDQMLDSTDIAVLQTIAFQCPATGGNAVYKARALLMVIMHELSVYDDQASCSQGQALIVPTRDGHDTNTPQQRFLVFPNPAKDNIQVTWLEAAKQSGQVVLSDIYGRPICRKTIPLGSNSCVLSLQGASNGLYILHIDLDGIRTAEKIVVKY
jgi:hypothetical protein